jgi:Ca2+-binding EF-hand superfamily protein
LYDRDGDGYLNKDEFWAVFDGNARNGGGDAKADHGPDMPEHLSDPKSMYRHFASDPKGGMTRDEFHALAQEHVMHSDPNMDYEKMRTSMDDNFDKFDKNGNMRLDRKEFTAGINGKG